jgi:hypothetical protein
LQVFQHTYDTPNNNGNPWVVRFKGCCRMSTLINNADESWDMTMTISLTDAMESPRIVSLPVIFAQKPASALPSLVGFNLQTAKGANIGWMLPTPGLDAPAKHNSRLDIVTLSSLGNVTIETANVNLQANPSGLVHILAYAFDRNTPQIKVPVDLLVQVTNAANSDPQFNDATLHAFSQTQHARPGFDFTLDIAGFIRNTVDTTMFVGFTVGPLPEGMHLSTVRGKGTSPMDPAVMTLRWMPCMHQLGRSVVCFDVVNNRGVASTQRCLLIEVVTDTAPTVTMSFGGKILARDEVATLYIGASYVFTATAMDNNYVDQIMLMPSDINGKECTPPACMPAPPGSKLTHVVTSVVDRQMIMSSMNISFAPAHNHGGYLARHCVSASDSCGKPCGSSQCPGLVQTSTTCIMIKVERCQFIVRPGQELQEIAAIYRTDWLQLWSHNQQLMSPDTNLMPGSIIHIGHLYAIQPFDKPVDVATRFGMSPELFNMLNADIAVDHMGHDVCKSIPECENMRWCILPSSCEGNSGSIYQGAYKDQPWFSSTMTQPPHSP